MAAFYNDNDPAACVWLESLISKGLIPDGKIDSRHVQDLTASDAVRHCQCHFFAGIGGWPYALRLAGWPDERPVWTASLPCQPFSSAGKGRGFDDERHLWPVLERLVAECRPPVLFGEQVASPTGRTWLARVRRSLEALGYAVGAADLCAAGVGAPHIRQRLFWVADIVCERIRGERRDAVALGRMGDRNGAGPQPRQQTESASRHGAAAFADGGGADPSPWNTFDIVACNDGRVRRTPSEPAFFPLADGLPGRVAQLRGLGNAIVPQVAAEFIKGFLETQAE